MLRVAAGMQCSGSWNAELGRWNAVQDFKWSKAKLDGVLNNEVVSRVRWSEVAGWSNMITNTKRSEIHASTTTQLPEVKHSEEILQLNFPTIRDLPATKY